MDALHIVYAYFAKVFIQSHLNEDKQKQQVVMHLQLFFLCALYRR